MEGIPSRTRMDVIGHNIDRVVGTEDGPLRDIDTGRFTDKDYRGVAKK